MNMTGLTGSQLEAKYTNAPSCFEFGSPRTTSSFEQIFLTPVEYAFSPICTATRLTLRYNQTTQCVEDAEGIEVRGVDFGGTRGVDNLDDNVVGKFPVFEKLTEMLVSQHGYQSGVSVRGASYDWRKPGDRCFDSEQSVKVINLIQETYEVNSKSRVVLICHSMGCTSTVNILNNYVSKQWVSKYIRKVIMMSPANGGSSKVSLVSAIGPADVIQWFSVDEWARGSTKSWPSLLNILPASYPGNENGDFWNGIPLVISPSKNYTIDTIWDFVFDKLVGERVLDGEMVRSVERHLKELRARPVKINVDTDIYFVTDIKTIRTIIFSQDDVSSDDNYELEYGLGDKTVNLESLQGFCNYMASVNDGKVSCHPLTFNGKVDHYSILYEASVVDMITRSIFNNTSVSDGHQREVGEVE
jgi:hypothetical protein